METKTLETLSMKPINVKKVYEHSATSFSDIVSVEEPLEISIGYGPMQARQKKNISVTMRTPGNDLELALGFLFTEGIITHRDQLKKKDESLVSVSQEENTIQVELAEDFTPHLAQTDRNFYTTSSCGVCGKSSIQSIKTVSPFTNITKPMFQLSIDVLYQLPQKLRAVQNDFSATGGIHASGLFSIAGDLVTLREDVGRHNALDKLIGSALLQNRLPLNEHILLLSGRASFELIQKAVMAGITMVAAIGAPSSLAVELAQEANITLFGFLKESRCNIYHLSNQHSIEGMV